MTRPQLNKYQCRSIADICCGTGDFAALTPADGRYNGWDINDDFIIYARNRYKGHSRKLFSKLDVLHPPNTFNKRFDAVMLISTLHHFSDNDLAVLLPFVSRISNKLVIVADI